MLIVKTISQVSVHYELVGAYLQLRFSTVSPHLALSIGSET